MENVKIGDKVIFANNARICEHVVVDKNGQKMTHKKPACQVGEVIFVDKQMGRWITVFNGTYNTAVWVEDLREVNTQLPLGVHIDPFTGVLF